ncbi:hypothetical protein Y032_0071g538 [Ancylostoma ceylanicum]|nr:hypothetical protein Y032_0071g538 [Ancylostoma ceylanicum]
MDHGGRACMFGTHESIVGGRVAVRRMFNENGLGPFDFKQPTPATVQVDSNNNKVSNVDSPTASFEQKSAEGWVFLKLYFVRVGKTIYTRCMR